MVGNSFEEFLHTTLITISSDQYQKDFNVVVALEQYSVLGEKEYWGDYSVQFVIVSA